MADRKSELQAADPAFAARPLAELNSAATKALKAGDPLSAVAIYDILFDRSSKSNITHPELYVCYSNCSAACLELELYEQAMSHAEKCTRLAEASLRRYDN